MATPETNREIIERLSQENERLKEEAQMLLSNVEQLSRHVAMLTKLKNPEADPFDDLEDDEGA